MNNITHGKYLSSCLGIQWLFGTFFKKIFAGGIVFIENYITIYYKRYRRAVTAKCYRFTKNIFSRQHFWIEKNEFLPPQLGEIIENSNILGRYRVSHSK
jgi:hypothetical protein